ncbi:LysR family transcriptional regulator [Photobacterium atrarenae]|uniref:LysR family transcriptional regulator n=1 Tax=Photobacterium atrarenae TaxID=865757 RepID=A0ABY5GLQ7_9GAMM|nr:LysR family transcriptional regulator [Photobacterium atrarenae]UTV29487.1 LysR family transcriptional regulator [Photobacterium atrarenae]
MDFNQVRYFLALANTLNFTRAAEQCYVSQPALTQAIKRLETELGGELFLRDGRHTRITALGQSLRGHFEQIDHTRHLVRATARAVTSGEIAELNIGVMCTIGPWLITEMLDTFQAQHPMISITLHDVTPASIPPLLLSGAIDGALCARHGSPHSQLRYISLFEERMVVAFPPGHEFSNRAAVPLRAIARQRYVDRLHCEFRQEILQFHEAHDIQQDVAFRSQREDWIQSMVLDGVGVSVMPQFSLLHTKLEHRPIIDPVMSRKVEFAVVDHPQSPPALSELLKHVSTHDWSVAQRDASQSASS